MPLGDGSHDYSAGDGTLKCVYGCGCWKDSKLWGGPKGINPDGECPNNPKTDKLQQLHNDPCCHL